MTDWSERICAISVHPDSATRREVADLAADLMAARAALRAQKLCRWTQDEDSGAYDTACGHKFMINEGTPAENGMQFCCYCGGALKERKR